MLDWPLAGALLGISGSPRAGSLLLGPGAAPSDRLLCPEQLLPQVPASQVPATGGGASVPRRASHSLQARLSTYRRGVETKAGHGLLTQPAAVESPSTQCDLSLWAAGLIAHPGPSALPKLRPLFPEVCGGSSETPLSQAPLRGLSLRGLRRSLPTPPRPSQLSPAGDSRLALGVLPPPPALGCASGPPGPGGITHLTAVAPAGEEAWDSAVCAPDSKGEGQSLRSQESWVTGGLRSQVGAGHR